MWSAEDGRQLQCMEAQDEPVKMVMFDKVRSTLNEPIRVRALS